MYYTIRPAAPATKRQQLRYYFMLIAFLCKVMFSMTLLVFTLVAVLTANYAAIAVLFILVVLVGIGFNFLHLRYWLPGWRKGSWFTRTIWLTLYLFGALSVLLLLSPAP